MLKIMLVEDHSADAILIQEFLAEASPTLFELTAVVRLSQGLEYLSHQNYDIILLDLSLPDSQGLDTLTQVISQVPHIPIVILTAMDDEKLAVESVRKGAQDYLVKGRFEGELLIKAIRYAIERHRIEATLRLQAERERLLGRMLERIHHSLNLAEILRTTVVDIQQFFKVDRVLIYRCQPGTQKTKSCFVVESASMDDSWERLDQYAQLARPCFLLFNTQQIHTIRTVQHSDPTSYWMTVDPEYQALLKALDVESAITVPILQNQTTTWGSLTQSDTPPLTPGSRPSTYLWGFLMVHQCQDREWQQWEIDVLKQLSAQLSIAIQQSELCCQLEIANQQLQRLAMLDGLTGIANRRQFDQALQETWQQLAKEKKPLSLLLCDIDFFKLYNDYYGHLAGDQCLRQVATTIHQSMTQPLALVSRYGGEEFAVILPRTEEQDAVKIGQTICDHITALHLPHRQSPISQFVTISIGLTTTIPNLKQSPSTLVQIADQALYTAKSQGRNCMIKADYPDYSYSFSNSG